MSECTSCKFREGDCGHHHVDYDGNLHLDIPGLPSCDKYGQCMSWERSIESRRKEIGEKLTAIMKALQKIKDLEDEIAAVSRISIKYNWRDAKKELPPEGRHILVTLDHGGGDLEVTEIDYGVCRYMAEHEHVEECAKLLRDVVAWMELPGPWEKESS